MMRRTIVASLVFVFTLGLAAAAQVSVVYQKRTKRTFLQITLGYPNNGCGPWYAPTHHWNAPAHAPAYYGGTFFVPTYGVQPAYPAGYPWAAPAPGLPAPPPLTSKYTKYLPPASLGKSAAKGLEALALFDRGLARLKAGKLADALESLRGAILVGPDNAELEAVFALALAASKDFLHADKAVRSVLAAQGPLIGDPKALLASDEAWSGVLKALEAEKGPSGKLTLAFLRASAGEKAKARETLDKLLQAAPDDPALQRLRAVVAD